MLPGMNFLLPSLPSQVIPTRWTGLHTVSPSAWRQMLQWAASICVTLDKDILVYPQWCQAGLGRPILQIPFLPKIISTVRGAIQDWVSWQTGTSNLARWKMHSPRLTVILNLLSRYPLESWSSEAGINCFMVFYSLPGIYNSGIQGQLSSWEEEGHGGFLGEMYQSLCILRVNKTFRARNFLIKVCFTTSM